MPLIFLIIMISGNDGWRLNPSSQSSWRYPSRRDIDQEVMAENQIKEIDLVVVNLYPFIETIAKEDTTLEIAIENTDIGGPSMVRSAAKNNLSVGVL